MSFVDRSGSNPSSSPADQNTDQIGSAAGSADSILQAAHQQMRAGEFVLILDDTEDTTLSYLAVSAANIRSEQVAFMADTARGVIIAAVQEQLFRKLSLGARLGDLEAEGRRNEHLDFGISVEAREGVGTGISASDRAATLRALASTETPRGDLITPGHIFTVMARKGGLLIRSSIAEAACDLGAEDARSTTAALQHKDSQRAASGQPVVALCQCLKNDGEPLSESEAHALSRQIDAPVVSISAMIYQQMRTQKLVSRVDKASLPILRAAGFDAVVYRSHSDDAEHVALIKGIDPDKEHDRTLAVRVQAERKLDDLLGFSGGISRRAIHSSLQRIAELGSGIFVYIRQPKSSALRQYGYKKRYPDGDISPENLWRSGGRAVKEYGIGAQILRDLGARELLLLRTTETSIPSLESFGIEIFGTEQLVKKKV